MKNDEFLAAAGPEFIIPRVGTKKMTIMDFHEILPLYQFNSELQEFLGYFYGHN